MNSSLRIFLIVLVSIPSLAIAQPATVEKAKEKSDPVSVESLITEFRSDKPYVGIAVGIIDGDTVTAKTFGPSDGKEAPLTPDHLFEIGSITKTFTGLLLARSVLAERVKLDDPANEHLPDDLQVPTYKPKKDDDKPAEPITLLRLATHRSGMPVQPPGIGLIALLNGTPNNPYSTYGTDDLSRTLKKLKLNKPPGEFEYSNLGMGMLGHALVNAAKADSYETLVREQVLAPLEMNATCIVLDDAAQSNKAVGHSLTGTALTGWDLPCLEGCGALRSSLNDMLKYTRAHLGHGAEKLQPAIKLAIKKHVDDEQEQGLAWIHIQPKTFDETILFHNGGTGGYRSFLGIIPETDTAVVVLSNSDHSVDELGLDLLKLLQE